MSEETATRLRRSPLITPVAISGVLPAGDRNPRAYGLLAGYFHKLLDETPRIGDTTSSIALVFSPTFLSVSNVQPLFPNYTFPAPDLPPPDPSSPPSNSTLVFFPGLNRHDRLSRSACALKEIPSLISTRNSSFVLRGLEWKVQYLIEGLDPGQSYIAYSIVEDNTSVTLSQPATVITKSGKFLSPLALCYLY